MATGNTIIEYTNDTIRKFLEVAESSYEHSRTKPITFEEWRELAYPVLVKQGAKNGVYLPDLTKPVRIAPSTADMLRLCDEHSREFEDISLNSKPEEKSIRITNLCKELFQPACVINRTSFYDDPSSKLPIWFNTTEKGIVIRPGFDNGNSATPATVMLGEDVVHMMAGGRTGSGKSVLIHDILANLLLEYPPWEVSLYLADFKIVELSRYANRFPTPHVKVVAATSCTEYILSMYEVLKKENADRMRLFAIVNVQNIRQFRKKFGLVMPQILMVTDEFTQMYANIKDSEDLGNDHADDDRRLVNSSISAVARLGRSQGVHMLPTSQNLENLDPAVSEQFMAGAALGCDEAVSNSLIGNNAATGLRGKGKAYYNLNKNAKDKSDNVLVRVPLLESEQSEDAMASGSLTALEQILKTVTELSTKYNYRSDLKFFDETAAVPYAEYVRARKYCMELFDDPELEDPIDNEVFQEVTAAVLPLGKELKLDSAPTAYLQLKLLRSENIILAAKSRDSLGYILRLLINDFSDYEFKHSVIDADRTITMASGIESTLNCKVYSDNRIPEGIYSKFSNRKWLVTMQNVFLDKTGGAYDDDLFLKQVLLDFQDNIRASSVDYQTISKFCHRMVEVPGSDGEAVANELSIAGFSVPWLCVAAEHYGNYKLSYERLALDGVITARSFSPEVIWFMGMDNFIGFEGQYDTTRQRVKAFMSDCSKYNMFCVVTATHWDKLNILDECCNHIIERCDKTFFSDLGIKPYININKNTFQYHCLENKDRKVCSMYSRLE